MAALPPFAFDERARLLVLAPHPDDESLCCAGLVQKVLAGGGEVYLAWITLGDGFQWDAALLDQALPPKPEDLQELALRRQEESRAAASVLGVPGDHLFFLGYPDRGLLPMFLQNFYFPYRSKATGLDRVAYSGTLSPGAPYTGESWESDLRRVFEVSRPTLVLAPAHEDAHPDHRATGYMALRILGEMGALDRMVLHGPRWAGVASSKGTSPQSFPRAAPKGKGASLA